MADENKEDSPEKKEEGEKAAGEEAKKEEAKEGEKAEEKKPEEKGGEEKKEEKAGEKKEGENAEGAEKKDGDKKEGEKKEGEKKDEEKPDGKKDEKEGDKKDDGKPGEKKDEGKPGEKKDEAKPGGEKKDEGKPGEKKDEGKPGEKKDEGKPGEKKDEGKLGEKKDEGKPGDKKEEAKPEEKAPGATPAVSSQVDAKVTTIPPPAFVTGRLGRKVNLRDLHPAEAVIKTRERSKRHKAKTSSSGSATITSTGSEPSPPPPLEFISSSSSAGRSITKAQVLENAGATGIADEEYFKRNRSIITLRDREICTGTYATYYRVKLQSREDQAVKIITLINIPQAYKENLTLQSSKIMRWLSGNAHDRIVTPIDLFITQHKFYMFVPNYGFGNLESLVTPKSAPKESAIKKLIKQMAEGMQFLVSNCIAHKAIKTTHGVFASADKKKVKLCGFGNAIVGKDGGSVIMQKKILKESFLPYMAPEMLKGDWDPFIADVFSLGLVIMALLTKRYPFGGQYKQQSRKRTDLWRQHFQRFGVKPSKELEDLLDKVVADPASRISLDDFAQHSWLNG